MWHWRTEMKKKQTKEQLARFVWRPSDVKIVKRSDSGWSKAKDASRGARAE
jgi:hypothetical protein